MHTDVDVAGMEVLTVVLTDVTSSLRFRVPDIRTAIQKGEMGHTQMTKDFLETGSKEMVVHRDGNSKRRKCNTIILSKLDADIVTRVKNGKFKTPSRSMQEIISHCIKLCCVTLH